MYNKMELSLVLFDNVFENSYEKIVSENYFIKLLFIVL